MIPYCQNHFPVLETGLCPSQNIESGNALKHVRELYQVVLQKMIHLYARCYHRLGRAGGMKTQPVYLRFDGYINISRTYYQNVELFFLA